MQRRDFLAAAGLAASPVPAQGSARFEKGICSVIFPRSMPVEERFRRARDAGFTGVEIRYGDEITPQSRPDEVKRIGDAARKAGVTIVSLWVSEPFSANPLNSPDPETRARGLESLRQAIRFATYLDCGALLLVPGRLGNGPKLLVGYEDTWKRVSAEFAKALPDAERARVTLTPENVWNKFLVSPLEMRAFVDQFHSPWLQTHFDVGNVMQFGYPQDWILTLGPRVKRVHVKDYKLSTRAEQGHFVDLLEGDVDWKEVMAALVKVGYRGFVSPEVDGGNDPERLRNVSRALDRILSLA